MVIIVRLSTRQTLIPYASCHPRSQAYKSLARMISKNH